MQIEKHRIYDGIDGYTTGILGEVMGGSGSQITFNTATLKSYYSKDNPCPIPKNNAWISSKIAHCYWRAYSNPLTKPTTPSFIRKYDCSGPDSLSGSIPHFIQYLPKNPQIVVILRALFGHKMRFVLRVPRLPLTYQGHCYDPAITTCTFDPTSNNFRGIAPPGFARVLSQ